MATTGFFNVICIEGDNQRCEVTNSACLKVYFDEAVIFGHCNFGVRNNFLCGRFAHTAIKPIRGKDELCELRHVVSPLKLRHWMNFDRMVRIRVASSNQMFGPDPWHAFYTNSGTS